MSVVWQADIFCDGPQGNGCKAPSGSTFVEHGETFWGSTKGCAASAWAVAKHHNWAMRRLDGRVIHLCPHCAVLPRE